MNRSNAVANVLISFAPFALAAIVTLALNPIALIVVVGLLYAFGVAKLIRAKMSLIHNHQWISFGPSAMDSENRILYLHAYAAIGTATFITLAALLLTRMMTVSTLN